MEAAYDLHFLSFCRPFEYTLKFYITSGYDLQEPCFLNRPMGPTDVNDLNPNVSGAGGQQAASGLWLTLWLLAVWIYSSGPIHTWH